MVLIEGALLQFGKQVKLAAMFEYNAYMLIMVSLIYRVYQYIININNDEQIQEIMKYIIHHVLKYRR